MNSIRLDLGYDVTSVAVQPAGRVVAAGRDGGYVTVHRLMDGALVQELPPQPATVWSLAFSPDGALLAIGSDDNPFSPDGAVEVWRTSPWEPIASLPTDGIGSTWSLDWTADSRHLAVGHADGIGRLWDVVDTRVVQVFDAMSCELPKVACSPYAPLLAHGCDEVVHIVRLTDGTRLHQWDGHRSYVHDLAWSPTDSLLAVCADDNEVVWLWDTEGGCLVRMLQPGNEIMSLAFAPNGQHLACGGMDGRLRIMRVSDGIVEVELPGHSGWVRDVAWAPDGRVLVSSGTDGTLRIWH